MKSNWVNLGFPLTSGFVLALLLSACNAPDIKKAPAADAEKASFDRAFGDTIFSREFGRIISLCGEWEIGEGSLDKVPSDFPSTIPVPGLVTSATPAFQDAGAESPLRQAFWYRKKFTLTGELPDIARLKIFKTMFGARVILNGHDLGTNWLSFAPQYYNLTPYLKGKGEENELIIRVGADISVMPDTVVAGGDPERRRYPPGIYDRVEIILSSDPYISTVQVVPDIEKEEVGIAVNLRSSGAFKGSRKFTAVVYDYQTGEAVQKISFKAGVTPSDTIQKITTTVPIPDCQLWSPEHPNLYVLKITDGTYHYYTRFGMRTFSLDKNYTNRALLNGKPYFIRGTNLAVHRFFEDSLCGQLPWNREWVRKLIRKFTVMEMNGARFAISQAPEIWYDIADEEGLLVFDEYCLWYAYQPDVGDVSEQAAHPNRKWGIWPKGITTERLTHEYEAWIKDRWNHPSVCVWDAQNETWARQTGEALMRVRKMDLSNRPWDNGWSPPMDSSDMREAHPYFEGFIEGTEMAVARHNKPRPFTLADIPSKEKVPQTFYLPYEYVYKLPAPNWYWKQPCAINEYSYLWLKRNGEPTTLTKKYYDTMVGEDATPDARREFYARYLAAVTEYWRATRSCFAILYPFGLAGSLEECETSDNFIDIPNLLFDDHFNQFVPDAFAALGVCPELWQKTFVIQPWWGTRVDFPVSVINDTELSYHSMFYINMIQGSDTLSRIPYHYTVEPYGSSRTCVKIDLPAAPGKYLMVVELHGRPGKITRSYRDIEMVTSLVP
jgi:hypothetical protein